jgi:hypothetical protein
VWQALQRSRTSEIIEIKLSIQGLLSLRLGANLAEKLMAQAQPAGYLQAMAVLERYAG